MDFWKFFCDVGVPIGDNGGAWACTDSVYRKEGFGVQNSASESSRL